MVNWWKCTLSFFNSKLLDSKEICNNRKGISEIITHEFEKYYLFQLKTSWCYIDTIKTKVNNTINKSKIVGEVNIV